MRACSIETWIMAGSVAVAAMALGLEAPAHANEVPDFSLCEGFPLPLVSDDEREHPLSLPHDWVGIAASSHNWIAVATEYGTTYCVNTQSMLDGSDFERFGERFLGFSYVALETEGYILIDRAGQGHAIETGVRPVFSPDGNRFAVLSRTDTQYGGFDGFAIWDAYGGELRPYLINSGPPYFPMIDWRIDYWDGQNCLHISAVPYDQINGNWDKLPDSPRYSYVAHPAIEWQILEGETCPSAD